MDDSSTEELLTELGPGPLSRRWLLVGALTCAVVVGTGAYVVGHHSTHPHRSPQIAATVTTTPLAAPTPPLAQIDTASPADLATTTPGDGEPASTALQPNGTGAQYSADGSASWTADFTNDSGLPVRLAGPIQVHVSPLLHAQITGVHMADGASPVVPGSDIYAADTVRLTVDLRFDCAAMRASATPYPSEPITVVLMAFGYVGQVVTVLGEDPGDGRPGPSAACPAR